MAFHQGQSKGRSDWALTYGLQIGGMICHDSHDIFGHDFLVTFGATFIPSLNNPNWTSRVKCRSIVLLLQGLEDVGKVILFLLPAMCLVESIDHMILGENIARVCGGWQNKDGPMKWLPKMLDPFRMH